MLGSEGDEMEPPSADKSSRTYRSYLLRLWRADHAGQPVCRASLEAPGNQTQIYFESLAALCAYLATQVGASGAEARTGDQKEADE
jgi:hypothetical protein